MAGCRVANEHKGGKRIAGIVEARTAARTTNTGGKPSAIPAGIAAPSPPTGAIDRRKTVVKGKRFIRRPKRSQVAPKRKQARSHQAGARYTTGDEREKKPALGRR